MFSKTQTSTMPWPEAIVSSEEIAALLHDTFPLNPFSLNKKQSDQTELKTTSLSGAVEPCQLFSDISLGSLF